MQGIFNVKHVTSWFKYIYIIHIILAGNLFFNNSLIMKISSAIVLMLGAVVLLYRLLNIKKMIRYPLIFLYIFFMLSYFTSTLVNIQYGWYNNTKIMIWMTLQFGVIYLFDIRDGKEYILKEFYNVIIIAIIVTSIMNLVSVLMLLANYFNYYEPVKGTVYLVGVAPWGRLFGVYADPNYSCVLAVIVFMASIFLIMDCKKHAYKVLLAVSLVLQAVYIACCASRTGLVTMCVCVTVYSFIYFLGRKKKLYKIFLISLMFLLITVATDKLIIEGYNLYTSTPVAKKISSFIYGFGKKEKMTKIGRDEELQGDISNRRFDLWNNACDIFKTSPVVGISYGNIVSYAEVNVPDSYLLTNGYAVFDAFHNMFFDLLVSQGIIGCFLFFLIIILSLRYLLKNIKCIPETEKDLYTFLFSTCVGILCSSFFVSEILYVNNQVTVLFWILWGYLIYFVNCASEKNNNLSNEEKKITVV